jgi:hypothetical protein
MVGFSPRMVSTGDAQSGRPVYERWQRAWWGGAYGLVLTKGAFAHRQTLAAFAPRLPPTLATHIDQHRNCEDIAMAALSAALSGAAPVWVQGVVFEVSPNVGGISSAPNHFTDRSECLHAVSRHLQFKPWKWVTGYQKAVSVLSPSSLLALLTLWPSTLIFGDASI